MLVLLFNPVVKATGKRRLAACELAHPPPSMDSRAFQDQASLLPQLCNACGVRAQLGQHDNSR